MDFKDLYEGPRYEKRSKRRRFNKLLNIGIVFVFVLIIFVSYKLIFGGGSEQAATEVKDDKTITSAKDLKKSDQDDNDSKLAEDETTTEDEEQDETSDSDEDSEEDTPAEETEMTVENSNDPNVKETIVNKAWKPVGTTQSEPHVATYDSSSTDWQEMTKAMEYATGLTQQDWILWRVQNGGSPNHAQGVVSTKDRKYVYRIQLEWVKNEGWKPSKLETLNEVPPEYTGTSMNTETTSAGDDTAE